MKRYIAIAAVIAAVTIMITMTTGCTPAQIKSNVEAAIVRDVIVPIAIPDFQAASDAAHQANDTKGAACWDSSLTYLHSLPTSSTAGDPFAQLKNIKGIASAIELERIQQATPAVAIPPIPDEVTMNCSLVVKDLRLFLLQLSSTAAKVIAAGSIGGELGAAKTLSAVKAAATAAAKP